MIEDQVCPLCRSRQGKGDGFCTACGGALVLLRYCEACGVAAEHDGPFCRECGEALERVTTAHAAEPEPTPPPRRPAPRAAAAPPPSLPDAPARRKDDPDALPVRRPFAAPVPVRRALPATTQSFTDTTLSVVALSAAVAGIFLVGTNYALALIFFAAMVVAGGRRLAPITLALMHSLVDWMWEDPSRRRYLGE